MLILIGILFVLAMIWVQRRATAAVAEGFAEEQKEGVENAGEMQQKGAEGLKVAIAVMMRKPTDVALWFDHHLVRNFIIYKVHFRRYRHYFTLFRGVNVRIWITHRS